MREARFVPDEGHKHARIVVVGEAPGRHENLKGKPFVGPSWSMRLHPWLSEVGLSRSDLYITNTYPYQPPGNQLNLVPKADREPWLDDLHNRIADLKEPVVLVPMGEYALHALTGKWKITNHRGSIYEYTDRRGRPIKVIPTLHPAATFRTLSWEARCRADWKRIASDSRFPELRLPVREHYIRPTLDDLRWFLEDARKADVIGLDIETPRVFEDKLVTLKSGKQVMKQVYGAARIACIGLALTPSFSITIPTLQSYWGARTLPTVWALIREILALPVPKIGQSGMPFDLWWLRQPEYACPVENYLYDTRWLHHCLNQLDEHSLQYMACLPGTTQVLTRHGWLHLDALPFGAEVAQWSASGELTWCKPKQRVFRYAGPLTRIESRHASIACTPNHRLPVLAGRDSRLSVEEAATAVQRTRLLIPCTGKLQGGYADPLAALYMMIQADGHIAGRRVSFCFQKERKVKRLIENCTRLGIEVRTLKPNVVTGARNFSIGGPHVVQAIKLLGKKKLFGAWLLELDEQSRTEFIDEAAYWDGTTLSARAYTYVSKERENVEWLATVAHVTGYRALLHQDPMRVTIERAQHINATAAEKTATPFDGYVFCLTTDTGFFLARSNGKVFVSGNSIDTREPFWKAEGKVEGDLERMPRDLDQFHRYCGKDVCTTVELANKYEQRIVRAGRWDFYCDWYLAMFEPLLRMSLHGTRLDDKARRWHVARMTANVITAQERLRVLNDGEPLYSVTKTSKGDISNAKLTDFLYTKLKLPKKFKTRKTKGGGEKVKTTTADEVTVRRLVLEHPKFQEPGRLILNIRHDSKQVAAFSKRVADADGRVRSSYGMTNTLRLTSSKNPGRTGRNMQNIDREKAVRQMFLPDPECLFMEVDKSTAESRVVYVRTEDPRLIEIAYSKPWEFDDHKRVAGIVLQKEMDAITKLERQVAGKTTNHASNYGERGKQMSDTLLKEDLIYTPEECQLWLDRRLAVDDGILRWHREVRRAALRDQRLTNAFGAVIDIRGQRLTDDLYRMLYAWEPQSTVAMDVNKHGLQPLDEAFRAGRWVGSRINLQTHDSITVSTRPEHAWEIARFLNESMQVELLIGPKQIPLTIPVEFKLGATMAMDTEFKRFPSRDEFMAAVEALAKEI